MKESDTSAPPSAPVIQKRCSMGCILFLLAIIALLVLVAIYYEPTPTPAGMCKVYD